MRLSSYPFVGGVVAVALMVTACGGSTESADNTPGDREASGLYRSTQLCVTNDTNATQNVSWTIFDTNDQKASIGPGDTTCGEGTFPVSDDVKVRIWQNSDRGAAWKVDLDLSAENYPVGLPTASVVAIDSEGEPADDKACSNLGCSYDVGTTHTYTYTPWGEATPVTVTMTRIADTEWKEFRVTLS